MIAQTMSFYQNLYEHLKDLHILILINKFTHQKGSNLIKMVQKGSEFDILNLFEPFFSINCYFFFIHNHFLLPKGSI